MFRPMFQRGFHATSRKLDLSKMTIVGRVGSEFTEYTSANNNRYLKYSVASQPRRDGQTNWFNVTVFSEPQINFLTQFVRKGALVYLEADASNYTFEREDGSRGTTLNLVQREFNLLRNGKTEEAESESN
ncbi:BN860_01222g1_1 [Zygosaccharomyces bailii CLIB 213]|uniref:Single-stranded DNA-binding protein n=1 Tax=Zygosaccharomyces bailii (strain CLIB 213 / ATCC 58445 / CBS 680 / BCRC 21525 / NBRC 1098 / NCYC 1416 / NRRL Y-2227) TaxID=1333698 RepID=A0A8J2T494_ZYGB2|nr:BN860_01222g1_1 [Zygosaccharomyces bailii CLIB 213]